MSVPAVPRNVRDDRIPPICTDTPENVGRGENVRSGMCRNFGGLYTQRPVLILPNVLFQPDRAELPFPRLGSHVCKGR